MATGARVEAEWLDRVAVLLAEPLTAFPDGELAAALGETFDLVGCSFNDRSPGPGALRLHLRRGWNGQLRELAAQGADAPAHTHPLLVYYRETSANQPMQIADLPPPFLDPALLGPWRQFARPGGFEHVLVLPLRHHHRAFALARDTPFAPAESALAVRLWRLVRGLDRQVTVLAPGPGNGAGLLTPRETAVIGLVARGLTAGAAARRLGIAERTVEKHLERVYRKVGARDRVTAVLRAQQAGLLPVHPP